MAVHKPTHRCMPLRADLLCCRRLCRLLCSPANGLQQKLYNWNTLNQKVLKKLGMQLTKQHMTEISNVTPGAIERALKLLKIRLSGCTEESFAGSPLRYAWQNSSTAADHHSPQQMVAMWTGAGSKTSTTSWHGCSGESVCSVQTSQEQHPQQQGGSSWGPVGC